MAWRLSALAALAKEPSLIPSTYTVSPNYLYLQLMPSSGFSWELTNTVYRHTYRQTLRDTTSKI